MTESNDRPDDDSASPLGLQILEELRIHLLQCQLVLISLADEVDLNFEECIAGLTAVRDLVGHAEVSPS